jgi:hypothetical protein
MNYQHRRGVARKNIFGKGETRQIDRTIENIVTQTETPGRRKKTNRAPLMFLDREYFYILRKMYHTFMFDLKEFAMDFLNISTEDYLHTLVYLTYVQSHIYKLDLTIEKYASHLSNRQQIDFRSTRDDLKRFLSENDLLDRETERCLDLVMRYLTFEYRQVYRNRHVGPDKIFEMLEWKSADLEILRRIILKICEIKIRKKEMVFFRLLDKIREIFDDIRDYEEDQILKNFNTLLSLEHIFPAPGHAAKILGQFIDKEYIRCLRMIRQMDSKKRNKFIAIGERLNQERKFYLAELYRLTGKQGT